MQFVKPFNSCLPKAQKDASLYPFLKPIMRRGVSAQIRGI
jgi:hypothetical protein